MTKSDAADRIYRLRTNQLRRAQERARAATTPDETIRWAERVIALTHAVGVAERAATEHHTRDRED